MSPESYGPSKAARTAHAQIWRDGLGARHEGLERVSLDAAHDPALGLDGSICKRAVIDRLQLIAVDMLDYGDENAIRGAADQLEREWSDGR